MLQVQTKAPNFTALDQDGKSHSLNDYKDRYVILYFYPKDDTPGCTKEACSIRDNYAALQKKAVVIGVSSDSVESHKKFEQKYHLPFTLLSDTSKEIRLAYEADGMMAKRITYLINPQGEIKKAYPKVNPSQHAEELLMDLQQVS